MYPDIKIVVGENGHRDSGLANVCDTVGAEYIQLPYDSGVCVGRNTLMGYVTTDYVLVGDDDFYYDAEARVNSMREFLDVHTEYDLIGGRVREHGIVKNYQGTMEKLSTHFQSYPINADTAEYKRDERSGLRYCSADLTFNYFVARTEKVRAVPWDDEIKVAYEHFSWFYDFKCAGGKVAFTPDAIVVHKPEHIANKLAGTAEQSIYAAFRNRKSDKDRFFAKYNITYTIGMNGQKTYAPDHIVEVRKNDTKFVDFCITTFKRPKALERLLLSIAEYYPMANVYVADQNETLDRDFYKKLRNKVYDAGLLKRVSIEHLPYDCGLSYARNHLVRTTPNKYKLILDDDMMFTRETDIKKMVTLLEAHPRAGVVGGLVTQLGSEVHFEFNLEIKDQTIYQVPDGQKLREHMGIKYKRTGCVLNFALFRKELFDAVIWDNDLKVTEHMDFYLRLKSGTVYNVLYTPDVVIDHPPTERDADYKDLRQRKEFMVKMLRKHKVQRVQYLNGQVTELTQDGELKRYKNRPV
jgi:GT2 family glycosyltransferase